MKPRIQILLSIIIITTLLLSACGPITSLLPKGGRYHQHCLWL